MKQKNETIEITRNTRYKLAHHYESIEYYQLMMCALCFALCFFLLIFFFIDLIGVVLCNKCIRMFTCVCALALSKKISMCLYRIFNWSFPKIYSVE